VNLIEGSNKLKKKKEEEEEREGLTVSKLGSLGLRKKKL